MGNIGKRGEPSTVTLFDDSTFFNGLGNASVQLGIVGTMDDQSTANGCWPSINGSETTQPTSWGGLYHTGAAQIDVPEGRTLESVNITVMSNGAKIGSTSFSWGPNGAPWPNMMIVGCDSFVTLFGYATVPPSGESAAFTLGTSGVVDTGL